MMSRIAEATVAAFLAALVCSPALASGAPPKAAPKNDALVMASVNEEPVTAGDLLKLFKDRHSGHASFLGGPNEAKSFLNIVIDDRLLIQEAFNLGLDTESEVARVLKDFIEKNSVEVLVKQETLDPSKPTAAEIEEAFKQLNVVLQARQIALPTRQEAEEVRASILRGGDAEAFARKCSGARSSRNGGNLMVSWGQFPPAWEAAVMPLQPGDVSEVIETNDSYEVVLVVNRVDVPLPEFKDVKERIGTILELRKKAALQEAFSKFLWDRYGAKVTLADVSAVALSKALQENPDTVIATWANDGKLTLADTFEQQELRQIMSFPAAQARFEIERRIRSTVNAPLSILEARARKIEEQPELAAKIDEYREFLMKNMLFRDHIFRSVVPTEEQAQKYYEEHKAEFEEAEQYHVAQILVATEKEANEVRSKLEGGADFSAMVEKYSRDPVSAQTGGDLGWVAVDKVPAAFAEMLELQPGSVTKPILNTTGAWHLIKVIEKKPRRVPPFAEVKEKAQKAALEAAKREQRNSWVSKLRAASEIKIDEAAVLQFVEDHKSDGEAPPQHALQ